MFVTVLFPPMRNAVATKLAGVVAGIKVDITFVSSQIIDTMRYQLAFASTGEIMIQGFHRGLGIGLAFAGKISD